MNGRLLRVETCASLSTSLYKMLLSADMDSGSVVATAGDGNTVGALIILSEMITILSLIGLFGGSIVPVEGTSVDGTPNVDTFNSLQ